jgi:hypothetical protein
MDATGVPFLDTECFQMLLYQIAGAAGEEDTQQARPVRPALDLTSDDNDIVEARI